MLVQFKYAFRHQLGQRLITIGATLIVGLFFIITGRFNLFGNGLRVTGIVLASLALLAIMVVSVIASVSSIRALFSAPQSYLMMQAPVSLGKMLFARLAAITIMDLAALTLGIVNIVMQSYSAFASPFSWSLFRWANLLDIAHGTLMIVIGYAYMIATIVFCVALSKSYFFALRGRVFLSLVATAAVLYLLSWTQLLLAPFGSLSFYRFVFTVNLGSFNSLGSLFYTLLACLHVAALAIGTTHMMKRRLNQ